MLLKCCTQYVSKFETLSKDHKTEKVSFHSNSKEGQCQRISNYHISSVQFSISVVSNSLWPHGLQHTRPPCPSPTPRVHPNSCPLSWQCHPTISSSVVSFSSCPQSFPASGSFQKSQLFASGGQSIGVSASTSILCSFYKLARLSSKSSKLGFSSM